MEKIRIGNDIIVVWNIYTNVDNEVPYDLSGRNLSLYMKTDFEKVKIESFVVESNTIRFTYHGKEQNRPGKYTLTLVENEGLDGMHTVDECDAFELVRCSCDAGGDKESKIEIITLDLNTKMSVGPVGPKGDKGDKGEKGDKGDKGEKGETGEPGASNTHNIGSIELFEQIIAERRNHNLTQEDKDAILSGKIITTSAGNGVVPTISSNSMGENGAVLIFHFNERLYEMFVMWTDTRCYINGVLSFAKETKLYADSELSETSENSVQNKVVTAKLTELSAEVGEVESILDAVTIKGEPSANLFKPTLVGSFFSLYGTDLPGANKYCQIEQVKEGDIFRMYIWSAGAYKPYKVNVLSAWSNGVAIAEKGASSVAEYVVPSDIDEIRVSMNFAEDVSLLCLTKNLDNAPSEKTQYEEGKKQIITDASLQKEGVPADAKAVGERLGARIDFAKGVDYQQNIGAINKLGVVDVNDGNYWFSSPIAVRRGEVVYMTTPYQGSGMAIGRTDADGNYYAPIAEHDNTKSYVANIDFDGYIAITFIKGYLPTEFYKETSQFAIDKGAAKTYADLEVAKKESAEIDYKALEVQHETHFTNLCIQARFERGKMVAELATLTDDDILAQGSCGYTESNGQITDGTIKWRIYKGGLLHISGYGKMYDFIKGTEAAKSEEEVHQKVRDLGAEFWYYGFVNENVNGIVPPFPQSNQKYDTDEVMNYSNKRYVPFGEDINPLNGKPYGYSAPWYIYRVHVDDSYTSYDLYKAKNPNEITYNRILIEEDASKGGITYIGNWAFYRVSADTLILPSSVTKIGCWGVRYSPVLKALVMGDNITTIEDHGVSRMEAMEAVKVSSKLVSLGYEGMSADAQLKMVDFPNTTTSLGSFCFNGCQSLQIANFGSIQTMPRNFATLSSLVKANIPSTTETIGVNAFYKTDINRLIIPSNVSNIESDAFRYVDIKVVVIESQSVLDKMTIQNAPATTQLQQGACIGRCDYILIPIGLTPSYAIEQLFLYKGEDENYRYYKRDTPKIALDS